MTAEISTPSRGRLGQLFQRYKPYFIIFGLSLIILGEILVVTYYASEGGNGGTLRAVQLNGALKSSTSTQRQGSSAEQEGQKESSSISGQEMNPVDSAFLSEDERKRAEQFGLK